MVQYSKGKDTADPTVGHNINFLIEHPTANAKVATSKSPGLDCSIDKVESEWWPGISGQKYCQQI